MLWILSVVLSTLFIFYENMPFEVRSVRKVYNLRETQNWGGWGVGWFFGFVFFCCLGFFCFVLFLNYQNLFLAIALDTTLVHITVFSQREAYHFVLFHCLMTSIMSVQSAIILFLSPQSLNSSSILQHCPTSWRHICLQFSFNNVGLKNKNLRRLLFTSALYMSKEDGYPNAKCYWKYLHLLIPIF